MEPIKFRQQNIVFAKNQPPYLPLPAYRDDKQGGRIFHCWKLSFRERVKIFFTGKIWVNVLNFGRAPQPIKLMIDNPFHLPRRELKKNIAEGIVEVRAMLQAKRKEITPQPSASKEA